MSRTLLAAIVLSFFAGVSASAEEPMQSVTMSTAIGSGSDQEVVKLYENAWTKLVQITLRNGKTLAGHSAKEPVTIQCVSGEGVLVVGTERIALKAGVVVPLDANVQHAVESTPAVSVLVTRFLSGATSSEHKH